jgi:hypothetical protein
VTVAFNFISERTVLCPLCFMKGTLYVRFHARLPLCLYGKELEDTAVRFGFLELTSVFD